MPLERAGAVLCLQQRVTWWESRPLVDEHSHCQPVASQEGAGNKYCHLSCLPSHVLSPTGHTQLEARGVRGSMEARLLGPREAEVERGFARVSGSYPVYTRSCADYCKRAGGRRPASPPSSVLISLQLSISHLQLSCFCF